MLELKDIYGGYGKITILNGTSFRIPEASITTVIGPNAVAPDVAIDPSLVCAAPFIALARLETSPAAALLATWHQGSLCAIGFQREGIRDAA